MALGLIEENAYTKDHVSSEPPILSTYEILEIFQQIYPEINTPEKIGGKYLFQARQIFNYARKAHRTFLSQRWNSSISVDYLMEDVKAACSTQIIKTFPQIVERIVEKAMQRNTEYFEDKGEM